jgi:tetratricopeptide (TPR) repeat protein
MSSSANTTPASPYPPQPDGFPSIPGYYLHDVLGRGGMGVVYRARDLPLGRDVAVKTTLSAAGTAEFLRESCITAQLPHPGVPPVHAVGVLTDGRPYLVMKLIVGRTLADVLKATGPGDSESLLGTFETICQTVGFAHSRGFIHRDLKPTNVMVGAFGEVQVMDWGLAKHIGTTATGASGSSPVLIPDAPEATASGSVKGTPAYLAPEQARGESVDCRTDVFALGGILAVILTGSPPFLGDTVMDTVLKAARAELDECFGELDECGADAELVAIAKRCLHPLPAARYANGTAVAAAVAAYRAGVQERLRRAERERAAAEARAIEQRKRRKVQLALAGSVLLLVSGGGGFAWWRGEQTNERKLADERALAERQRIEAEGKARLAAEQEFKAGQAREGIRAALKLATDLRKQYKFREADAALVQALQLANSAPELRAEVERAQSDLAFVVQLDDIRYRKWTWTVDEENKGEFNTKIAPPEYRTAFAKYGLDFVSLAPVEAAKRVATSAVRADLVAAVDDWALYEPDPAVRARLLEIARRADPGPWTDRLRDPAVLGDRTAVAALARDAAPATTSPTALSALAEQMKRYGLNPVPLLAAARSQHPTNFELSFALGQWYGGSSKYGEHIGPYEAARALRPDNPAVCNNLGTALECLGDYAGATAAYEAAIRSNPTFAPAHYNLGVHLERRGDWSAALAAYRTAIRCQPKYARAHARLGGLLHRTGDSAGAIVALEEAVRFDPLNALTYANLGVVHRDSGRLEAAFGALKAALRADPAHGFAHSVLGTIMERKGDLTGALAEYTEAVRHDSNYALGHYNRGKLLSRTGDLDSAIAEYKEAIRCDHGYAPAHFGLAFALQGKKEYESAVSAWKAVLYLTPHDARAFNNLGSVYLNLKRYPEAIACAREAVRLDQKLASAHALLGDLLSRTGDIPGARAALTEAARLDKRWEKRLAELPQP